MTSRKSWPTRSRFWISPVRTAVSPRGEIVSFSANRIAHESPPSITRAGFFCADPGEQFSPAPSVRRIRICPPIICFRPRLSRRVETPRRALVAGWRRPAGGLQGRCETRLDRLPPIRAASLNFSAAVSLSRAATSSRGRPSRWKRFRREHRNRTAR